jgi:hypothetical protein
MHTLLQYYIISIPFVNLLYINTSLGVNILLLFFVPEGKFALNEVKFIHLNIITILKKYIRNTCNNPNIKRTHSPLASIKQIYSLVGCVSKC